MNADVQSRQRRRNGQIVKSVGAGAIAKVISVSTSLITLPLTLHYLGTERFGMWMTLTSLIAFLSFADLGIGNGLLSSIATLHGKDDRHAIRVQISSAYLSLSAMALVLLALFATAYPFVDWPALFNVTNPMAKAEAAPAVAALFICFVIAVPLGIVQRVQMGLQQTYLSNLWQCASSLVTLAAVYVAIHLQISLPLLVLTVAGVPLIVMAINTAVFFARQEIDLRPSLSLFSATEMRGIVHVGGLFLVLQVVASATYMSDNIIIAQMMGPDAVAEYSVTQKLFSLLTLGLGLALTPLWPAYGEAIARRDGEWVRRILVRSLLLSASFSAVMSTILVLAAPTLIHWWVGTAVVPTGMLLTAFGVWKVFEGTGNALSMFLNGARIVKFQIITALATAVLAVTLKIILVGELGVSGVLWATSVSFLVCVMLPTWIFKRMLFAAANPV